MFVGYRPFSSVFLRVFWILFQRINSICNYWVLPIPISPKGGFFKVTLSRTWGFIYNGTNDTLQIKWGPCSISWQKFSTLFKHFLFFYVSFWDFIFLIQDFPHICFFHILFIWFFFIFSFLVQDFPDYFFYSYSFFGLDFSR